MKRTYIYVMAIFLGMTVLLSACVPGPRVVGTPGISLSEDMAFVAYGNFVFGLDSEKGTIKWHYPEKANNQVMFYAPPLVTENGVYVGDLANNFYKLDRETGAELWTFTGAKGYFIGQAAMENGTIYAPSNDGKVYALNNQGDLLWTFETGRFIWAQPQVSSDAIYIASLDHFVYALSKDGEEIWSTEMAGALVGAPLLSEDGAKLYVGSMGKQLVALDTTTGEQLWTFDAGGSLASVWANPIFVNGTLVIADSSGQVFGINPENGQPAWQNQVTGSVVGGLRNIPDGFVLTTTDGLIKALNDDGSSKWEATLGGEIFQAPAVSNDFVIVGTINGDKLVYAYSMSGVQLWSTTPEN